MHLLRSSNGCHPLPPLQMDLNVVQQGFPGESASGVAAQPASFTSLPDDLSLKIFGYLDHTERCATAHS